MSLVKVVAAVIQHPQKGVLIAKRPDHLHQGGLWEFPGGKLEVGESPLEALQRELHEELGISITSAQPFLKLHHDYSDKSVELDVWSVERFEGAAVGREGQQIRWVDPAELSEYDFPAANTPILQALSLSKP